MRRLHRVVGCWLARQDYPMMSPEFEVTETDVIGKVGFVAGAVVPYSLE